MRVRSRSRRRAGVILCECSINFYLKLIIGREIIIISRLSGIGEILGGEYYPRECWRTVEMSLKILLE